MPKSHPISFKKDSERRKYYHIFSLIGLTMVYLGLMETKMAFDFFCARKEEQAFAGSSSAHDNNIVSSQLVATATSSWHPISSSAGCPRQQKNIDSSLYKSQFEEDKMLMRWFGKLCNGTYLEMGALDGIQYSNSYVFHHGLG